MATRNIKDAKDLTTGELIYFKESAQATFMSDGRTVEEAVSEMSAKVIQEQQKEIKDLKQRLEVLENLVLQLTNREI